MVLDTFRLTGKNALVTGSRKGLGADIALALAQAGANVACHGKSKDSNQICEAVKSYGRNSLYVSGDVADPAVCERLIVKTVEQFGSIDILVNNAGVIRRSPALEYSVEYWDEVIAVNLTSVFRLSQLAARHMVRTK